MKTTALLAAAAAAFLFTSGPTLAGETQETKAQTQTKRCYRTVHKLPFRIKVPCRRTTDMKTEPKPYEPAPQPAPEPAPEKKP